MGEECGFFTGAFTHGILIRRRDSRRLAAQAFAG